MSEQPFCRLAFRVEGKNWNAYYAMLGTMEGAVYLGSVKMSLLVGNPQRRKQFITFMQGCFEDVCQQTLGVRPVAWNETPAPQHERSKDA